MTESEQKIIEAMRAHSGGIGESLSEKQIDEILYGRENCAENTAPIDSEKFLAAVRETLANHPVDWFLE